MAPHQKVTRQPKDEDEDEENERTQPSRRSARIQEQTKDTNINAPDTEVCRSPFIIL
jgi:hypothetical protein